jgi:hypothetical protein
MAPMDGGVLADLTAAVSSVASMVGPPGEALDDPSPATLAGFAAADGPPADLDDFADDQPPY